MQTKLKSSSIRTNTRVIDCLEEYRQLAAHAANSAGNGGADLIRTASLSGIICLALGAATRELRREPIASVLPTSNRKAFEKEVHQVSELLIAGMPYPGFSAEVIREAHYRCEIAMPPKSRSAIDTDRHST